jgi:hypothetical protein
LVRALRLLAAIAGFPIAVGCSDVAPLVGPQRVTSPLADGGALPDGGIVSFKRDIRPILDRLPTDPAGPGCRQCHYRTQSTHVGLDLGGLDLTTLGSLREGGGTSGARIVVPGRPEESAIIQKLRGTYPFGTRMPKSGPPFLAPSEIDLVATWIAQGAKGADDE